MVNVAGSLLPGVVGVSPFQCYTVYCSKFNCFGMVGSVLHKTISKHKAKMMGSQSCQFTGVAVL